MGSETAAQDRDKGAGSGLIGTYRRFGDIGPVYEVLQVDDEGFATICLVESGTTARYPLAEVTQDPPA